MKGTIIKNTGSWYIVRTDDDQFFSCKVKGTFRLHGIRSTNPVAVGDRVEVQSDEAPGVPVQSAECKVQSSECRVQSSECKVQSAKCRVKSEKCLNTEPGVRNPERVGLITNILDRRNYIIRKASNLSKQSHILAANVDQALLLVTIAHPETSTTFIDRFLAVAEAYRIPVILIFNKTDLYDAAELHKMQELMTLYRSLDYACLACSALKNEGLSELQDMLRDKTTLLSGNSGVGKSTLLNTLIPGLNVRTEVISEAHDTGQHTTTFSEMFDLPTGGYLIDTPGIKGFGTFDIERAEVGHYFREIFVIGQACRFQDCTHTHEPHCAVRKAVEEGRIAPSRYTSFLSMQEDKDEERYRKAY